MRPLLIIFCLLSLAVAGTSSAAFATKTEACTNCPTAQSGSAGTTDCDMGHNKAHKCAHDACCGYQLVAIAEVRDFSTPPLPRADVLGSVTKRLTSSRGETLLDPPRA